MGVVELREPRLSEVLGIRPTKAGKQSGPDQVLALLAECAKKLQTCPSDYEMSLRLGVAHATVIEWFSQLKRRGSITVKSERYNQGRRAATCRIVTLVAENVKTASPNVVQVKVFDIIEAAQKYLQQRDCVVFNFKVQYPTNPLADRLYQVDHRVLTRFEMLALARRRGFAPPIIRLRLPT